MIMVHMQLNLHIERASASTDRASSFEQQLESGFIHSILCRFPSKWTALLVISSSSDQLLSMLLILAILCPSASVDRIPMFLSVSLYFVLVLSNPLLVISTAFFANCQLRPP